MNELIRINNEEFGTIRAIEKDGEPWFVGKDVAAILGYSNPRKALLDHVDEDDKTDGVTIRDSIGRDQNPICINESGVYALIFGSKLPKAKEFKRWVTNEVLPSIRKHGVYMTDSKAYDLLHNEDSLADLLLQAGEQLKQKNIIINELKPKASYYDTALQSDSLISITAIAKDFGMSGKKLNDVLHNLGVQYKKGKMWFLYQDYADKGYTQSKTHLLDAKKSVMSMYWTQKGRQFIYELLKSKLGIMPIVAG